MITCWSTKFTFRFLVPAFADVKNLSFNLLIILPCVEYFVLSFSFVLGSYLFDSIVLGWYVDSLLVPTRFLYYVLSTSPWNPFPPSTLPELTVWTPTNLLSYDPTYLITFIQIKITIHLLTYPYLGSQFFFPVYLIPRLHHKTH